MKSAGCRARLIVHFVGPAVVLLAALEVTYGQGPSISIVEVNPPGPVYTGDILDLAVRVVSMNTPGNLTAKLRIAYVYEDHTQLVFGPPAPVSGGEFLVKWDSFRVRSLILSSSSTVSRPCQDCSEVMRMYWRRTWLTIGLASMWVSLLT